MSTDARLAAELAERSGHLLLDLRAGAADPTELRRCGDSESNTFLLSELAATRPDDAVLSEESTDDPTRLEKREDQHPNRNARLALSVQFSRGAPGLGYCSLGASELPDTDWAPDIDYHVNEFYLLDGSKFSTSRVWGKDILSPESIDAMRFHLSRTRPEGRRTNFELVAYEAEVHETLIDGWQRWLHDLGERLDKHSHYDGGVPAADVWTPEHTAFLDRLATRLAAVTGCLGHNAFSLNQAAEELNGIVEDALCSSRAERLVSGLNGWSSEFRTAIALELAAARLLAQVAVLVTPRFGRRLSEALGVPSRPNGRGPWSWTRQEPASPRAPNILSRCRNDQEGPIREGIR